MVGAILVPEERYRLPDSFLVALRDLDNLILSGVDKGLPDQRVALGEVGQQGWNILSADLPKPVLAVRQAALEHNIALMQAYCDSHNAWFAPHGKTMMTPQLWARQLQAGAWAITVANVAQLQVACHFGVPRILVANEMVTEYDARYLGRQLREQSDTEIYIFVDSVSGLHRLTEGLRREGAPRPLPVLVEFGMPGGRCGVRSIPELVELAHAVRAASDHVSLVGIAGYEGIAPGASYDERLRNADEYLRQLVEAGRRVRSVIPDQKPFLLSAGGSVYFDRVVELVGSALPDAQLVLRSGGYVTHDSSFYEKSSPFGSRSPRPQPGPGLVPALEVWSSVISVPEPGLAILGMGGRDMPTDIEMPTPLYLVRLAELKRLDERYTVLRANDQHAYLRIPSDADVRIGDLIGCGVSHPCTAFDKWRVLFLVDEDRNVVGALRTFF